MCINVCVGRVTIQLSDMPNGQDDDKWHQLMTKTSRTSQGSVRLVANFKVRTGPHITCMAVSEMIIYVFFLQHEIIFPIDEYTSLKDVSAL